MCMKPTDTSVTLVWQPQTATNTVSTEADRCMGKAQHSTDTNQWKDWYPDLLKRFLSKFRAQNVNGIIEDAVQNGAINYHRTNPATIESNISGYRYKIFLNAILDSLRTIKPDETVVSSDDLNDASDESNLIDRLEEKREIEHINNVLLGSLKTKDRKFILEYHDPHRIPPEDEKEDQSQRQEACRIHTKLRKVAKKRGIKCPESIRDKREEFAKKRDIKSPAGGLR
jgi:hypothetical protein